MYIVLFTVLHRFSNHVVKNGGHVSIFRGCHRGDVRVMGLSHKEELPITSYYQL